ncbi:DUF1707 domain-containing protein [Streptomyces sp. NPDC058653]|uniref:DUF1707 SHOCT-like domain-containing protein n=1 Tax=Streptomyces sp. NPDC058653 TaxID=3346576 RepID=UPI00365B53D2
MTSELPEMRASDAERERVAELLRDALSEGRIDMEEFDTRLDATYKARTRGELQPLVRDLPAAGSTADLTPARSSDTVEGAGRWATWIGRGRATSRAAFSMWGGFNRKGTWTVGRRFHAFTMMGGGQIDLREARFEGRQATIRCFALMGGMHVVIPPDMDVTVRGLSLMGGFGESGETTEMSPGSPQVVITGFALMGGVGVERKMRSAEKRRLKEERKKAELENDRLRKELD